MCLVTSPTVKAARAEEERTAWLALGGDMPGLRARAKAKEVPPNASNVLSSCLALKPFQFRLLGDGELAEFGRFRRQVRLAARPHTNGFGAGSLAALCVGLV